MSENERWVAIPGETGYEASDLGRVRSVDRVVMRRNGQPQRCLGRVLTPVVRYDGRPTVTVTGRRRRFIHHLVLEAFVGPRPAGTECCHKDDDPLNNRLENLRWDSHSANTLDRAGNKGTGQTRRTHCPLNHPLASPNLVRSVLPNRSCLACNRARRRVSWWKANRGVVLDLRTIADGYLAEITQSERGAA